MKTQKLLGSSGFSKSPLTIPCVIFSMVRFFPNTVRVLAQTSYSAPKSFWNLI